MGVYKNMDNNTNNENKPVQHNKRRTYILIVVAVVLILLLVPTIIVACNYYNNHKNDKANSSSSMLSSEISDDISAVTSTDMQPAELSSDPLAPVEDSSQDEISSEVQSSQKASPQQNSGYEITAEITANVTNPIGEYVSSEQSQQLQLVNLFNVLPADFDPEITTLNGGKEFAAIAADALDEMIDACNAECGDGKLWAQSTYRSYTKQVKLYNDEVNKWKNKGMSDSEAKAKAATVVAVPGTSEHNTGLACDFNTITESFADTKMYDWLIEHCAEYGFIERFPRDKQDITGITWEPWHYRYVCVEVAQTIMQNGWCLEEYHYYNNL